MVIESNPIRVNFLLLLATVNNLHVHYYYYYYYYYYWANIFYLNTASFYTRFVIKLNVSTFTRFLIISLHILHSEFAGLMYDLYPYKLHTLCLPTVQ